MENINEYYEEYFNQLENEIIDESSKNKEIDKEVQLLRLQEMAKNYSGEDEIISFYELKEQISKEPPVVKLPSKIPELDELLCGGFMTQTVTTISALPKSGKTSFCMFLTHQMAENKPLWFALEESSKALVRKMIKNNMTIPLAYTPKKNLNTTLEWIEFKILESYIKFGTKIVFIDQLDFIVEQDNRGERHDLKIAQTMRNLHKLAVKLDVAIFLICHLEKMEADVKPTIKNLRGSSAIWGEADNCIFLWRQCGREDGELIFTDNVLVSLQANREDGLTGSVKLIFRDGMFIREDWVSNLFEGGKELREF